MNITSIRTKMLLLFITIIVIPLLIGGILGALYFHSTLRDTIKEDNLAQAKSLSMYVDDSITSSVNYLGSLAIRPSIIQAMADNNSPVIVDNLRYAENSTNFYSLYVTDTSGKVLASYPDQALAGQNFEDEPYVKQVLATSDRQVMAPLVNRTGESAIFVSVPITGKNGSLTGVMVGEIDPDTIGDRILYTQIKNRQFIYMVNSTGTIIVHTNRSYMDSRRDYSAVPLVQEVMQGKEGIKENYNPIEKQQRLAAYSPVKSTGWGVIVAVPVSIAYQPIYNVYYAIAAGLIGLIAISVAAAYLFSYNLIKAILGLFEAARAITNRKPYIGFLPMDRKDEVGQVAVCMDKMARRIENERERILEERNRAELFVDIMGHDINNLNQVTIGNLDLIKDDDNLTPEQKDSITDALNSALGSASIIDNVRKIQAINVEKETMHPEDLNNMILECISAVLKPADRGVTLNYSPRPGLMIQGSSLMKEAFCNLINNAVKHSEKDVTIDISVSEATKAGKKFYDVSIADNGPGIPDQLKPKLFNRFQRGDTKAHGKGLGLFIVRSLVEQAGGNIVAGDRVAGDYGQGAKFIVSLPACEGCQ